MIKIFFVFSRFLAMQLTNEVLQAACGRLARCGIREKRCLFDSNFAFWEGNIVNFHALNNNFSEFLKSVLELIRSCLGIIMGFKRLTCGCIFGSKG